MHRPATDVSVVLCAYQQATTLRLIIECLLDQTTDASFEIIVCDDGSGADSFDSCRDIIQASAQPIYWIWQQDQGFRHAASTNNGLSLASGKYVIFLDGDMIPEHDFLEKHLRAHAKPGRLVVGQRLMRSLPEVEARLPLAPVELWPLLQGSGAVDPGSRTTEWLEKKILARRLSSRQPWHAGALCNLSVERSDAVYVDEFFHNWGFEDTEMAYRLVALEGMEVHYEPSAIAYHLADLDCVPWIRRGHEDITNYLRNFCYFLDKWPNSFEDYPMDLLPFELDPATNTWNLVRFQEKDFATFAKQVRRWMKENEIYPQKSATPLSLAS